VSRFFIAKLVGGFYLRAAAGFVSAAFGFARPAGKPATEKSRCDFDAAYNRKSFAREAAAAMFGESRNSFSIS
jgi:hypothetical protein